MATVREVATAAMRKVGPVAEGSPTMVDFDANVALQLLESLITNAVTHGLFGRLTPKLISADYTAEENQRIKVLVDDTIEITLPDTISDACAENGVREPNDLSVVVVQSIGDDPIIYLYETYRGDWVECFDLTLDSYAPLSSRGLDGLACWLAMKAWGDGYAGQPNALTAATARSFIGALSVKYDSPATVGQAEFF